MAQIIQEMHGLYLEELHWTLKSCSVLSYCNLVQRQEVLHDELLVDKDDSTSWGVEWSQQVIFGKMDCELYELLVKLFECWLAEWRECRFDRVMHVMVADAQWLILFFDASEIYDIPMVHFFQDIGSID
jgi:hypothetical protein